ncbi:cysteine hydrolase [Actinomadura sp. NPDC047616]|uniref:cysteine hydrolase n=1 Tax=Actinomadura sp. NPDC047616 TaxID=3155914 RepID=UPI0033F773B3
MTALDLAPAGTALLVMDLQVRVVGQETRPFTGADVVRQAMRLADGFRDAGGRVVIVKVERPGVATQPPGSELVGEMRPRPGDLLVTKRDTSAFHETGLDGTLREQGVGTVVVSGLLAEVGVEATARDAAERGYVVVLPKDATASLSDEAYRVAVGTTFPRLGTVCTTDEVLAALRAGNN